MLQNLTIKNFSCYEIFHEASDMDLPFGTSQQWKKYTRLIKVYEAMILPFVLHECETGSLTLREERNLKMFANRVLRTIFVSKKDKVRGECRRLHGEELCDIFSSTKIIWVNK